MAKLATSKETVLHWVVGVQDQGADPIDLDITRDDEREATPLQEAEGELIAESEAEVAAAGTEA